jgi:hypothetical protein
VRPRLRAGPLGRPGDGLAQRGRLQRPGQGRDLGGGVAVRVPSLALARAAITPLHRRRRALGRSHPGSGSARRVRARAAARRPVRGAAASRRRRARVRSHIRATCGVRCGDSRRHGTPQCLPASAGWFASPPERYSVGRCLGRGSGTVPIRDPRRCGTRSCDDRASTSPPLRPAQDAGRIARRRVRTIPSRAGFVRFLARGGA